MLTGSCVRAAQAIAAVTIDQWSEDYPSGNLEGREWCSMDRQLEPSDRHLLRQLLLVEHWSIVKSVRQFLHDRNFHCSFHHRNYYRCGRSRIADSQCLHAAKPLDMVDSQLDHRIRSDDSFHYIRCCTMRQTPKLIATLRVSLASSFTLIVAREAT